MFITVLSSIISSLDAMFSSHTTSIERLNNNNVDIPPGVTVHVAVACPPEGLTINACGREGKTILYISRTRSPNSANYEKILTIMAGRCRNTFVPCPDGCDRNQRQMSDPEQRVFVTIEGMDEENAYDLNAGIGDTSTPQGMFTIQADATIITTIMIGQNVVKT